MPGLTSSDTVELHSESSMPAPSAPDDDTLAGSLAALICTQGGVARSGPKALVVGIAASDPETITDVQAYLRREGTWRLLSVPGATSLFASLAIGPIPVEFVIELVGVADDLRIAATTAGGNTYTVKARRLDEVS